jgi:tetratricopeptide (TPR) repeat protein
MTSPGLAGGAQISRPAEPATGTGPAPGRVSAVRSGAVPALADGFTTRPETAPGLAVLVPGSAVALVSGAAGQPGERVGSCGKTQLAVFFAEALWRSGQVELLAWVDASSRASALSGYVEAAAAVGIEPVGPAEGVAARFTGWLAETARPWLVVLDDLRDPAGLDGLWPRGPVGRVLITTPDEGTVSGGPGESGVQVLPVGAFSTREALNYLMGRLAGDPDQRHGAIDLAIALGGDPCALTHASAVLATTTQSCRDYRRHYADKCARLAARQANGEPPAAPAVTWLLSAERAEQLSPGGATALLLALAALLDGQAVPGPVFTTPAASKFLADTGAAGVDADRAWQAVRALERTGLLTIDPSATPPVVRISRLVAVLVRAAMPEQMLERAAQAAAGALLEVWPHDEPQPWLAASLLSCAAALQHTAGDRLWTAESCHPLLRKAGHSIDAARLTGPAVRYWTQLAATSDRILGPDNPHTLTIGSHLARALLAAGQAAEAVAWWQWLAAGRTRVSGPDHPGTLAARVNLGRAMTAAGQPRDAVTILEQAVADYERVRGAAHPDTLSARDELAAACQAAGQQAEAIGHYRSILADRERGHGPRRPETITARERLAGACLADGRLKEAISGYKRTLADRERVLGADHLDTIAARRNLAAAYHTAGKIAAALQLHDQVCADYERALGAGHRHTLTARADLANAYHTAGRLTDAATVLRDTLSQCEQTLPPGDTLTRTLRQTMKGIAGEGR